MLLFYNHCLIVSTIIPKHKRFVNIAVAFGRITEVDLVVFCRNGVDKWLFWSDLRGRGVVERVAFWDGFNMKKPSAMPRAVERCWSLIYIARCHSLSLRSLSISIGVLFRRTPYRHKQCRFLLWAVPLLFIWAGFYVSSLCSRLIHRHFGRFDVVAESISSTTLLVLFGGLTLLWVHTRFEAWLPRHFRCLSSPLRMRIF